MITDQSFGNLRATFWSKASSTTREALFPQKLDVSSNPIALPNHTVGNIGVKQNIPKKYKKETWPNSYISSCLQFFCGTFHKTSKEKLYRHLFSLNSSNQGSFNNYAKHREWVGLSVFQDVAWRKARGWVILDERP